MSNSNMNDDDLRDIVVRAHKIAISYGHEYVTVEHTLAACLENSFVQQMLNDMVGTYAEVAKELDLYFSSGNIPVDQSPRPRQTTLSIKVLQRAAHQVLLSGRKKIEAYDVLISILDATETQAYYILSSLGVDILGVKTYITKQKQQEMFSTPSGDQDVSMRPAKKTKKLTIKQAKEILESYTTNLNELVKSGKIDKLIGRHKEIFKLSKILCRRTKNNILMVGEPGVGKTALAEGLAYRIVNKESARILEKAEVLSLEVGSIMAGTKYRGDLEERLQNIVQSIITLSEEENRMVILFIDEIHMMVGAGAGSESKAMDIGNLLKPALQKGALRVIGSTTYAEFRKHFEKDAALLRRFQRLDVGEPTVDEAIEIIKGLKGYYEEFHGITYTDEAVENAVKLAVKHIHKNHLPDKAIDIIDAAGAKNKVVGDENKLTELTINEIMDEIADIANIPVSKLKTSDNDALESLEPNLKSVIYGQDAAIETLVSSILIARAGMRDLDKPEACYLFNGPTGVGKTELAKQLALQLNMHFTRIDMSEFMEKHAVSKLIGSPPGYVGYDENGGLLVTTVDEHPHSVILLDEIEKAHPDVFNILLQVMDNGKLTNGNGKTVNFKDVILILTGNIGSAQAAKPKIGFGDNSNAGLQEEEVKRVFAPEFINRLDGVVTFNRLTKEVSDLILNKFINNLNLQLSEKGIILSLSERAKAELLKSGFDDAMGARPLSRTIHSRIKKPLAPKILFGELKQGGNVLVDYDEEFTFTILSDNKEIVNGDN